MAAIDGKITFMTSEYRPCFVSGKRALFHRWADSGRPVVPRGIDENETDRRYQAWSVHGIVEFEDGTVARVWPSEIRFASAGLFKEFSWGGNDDGLPFTYDDTDA